MVNRHSIALPENFVLHTWDDIKPYYDELLSRNCGSAKELKQLISDSAYLDDYVSENAAWRYIKQTCDTLNEDKKKDYERYINEIQPDLSKISDLLNTKILSNPFVDQLKGSYAILLRSIKREKELFREENIPLQQEISILTTQYGEIISQMTIDHEGKEITLKQAEIYLKNKQRTIRQQVREKIMKRREEDVVVLDILLDKLLVLRNNIALNCGFSDYASYMHYAKQRFDYSIDDVMNFHQSIKTIITPLCQLIHYNREKSLGYALKPYDFDVSIYDKQSTVCYTDAQDLIQKTIKTLNMTYPGFGDFIKRLQDLNQLDLDTRKGKGPGGYNYPMAANDTSFIFMNASTDSYGLFTMLHECGHALHHLYTYDIEPSYQRHPGSEICEIASMAQELLSLDKLQDFFENQRDYDISVLEKIEDDILMFPWISKIDLFQHWLYTNQGHTHEQRHQKRIDLSKEYPYDTRNGSYDAWSSEYISYLGINRQKQIHIFDYPFYYIEYAIASLAAIAMRRNYLTDPVQGIENYINLLKTGNTKTMPEIFADGGIRFDFTSPYIQELMTFLESKMHTLYNTLSYTQSH